MSWRIHSWSPSIAVVLPRGAGEIELLARWQSPPDLGPDLQQDVEASFGRWQSDLRRQAAALPQAVALQRLTKKIGDLEREQGRLADALATLPTPDMAGDVLAGVRAAAAAKAKLAGEAATVDEALTLLRAERTRLLGEYTAVVREIVQTARLSEAAEIDAALRSFELPAGMGDVLLRLARLKLLQGRMSATNEQFETQAILAPFAQAAETPAKLTANVFEPAGPPNLLPISAFMERSA